MGKTPLNTVPLLACVLIGGKSSRMGRPKHLLSQKGRSWLERTVAVLSPVVDEVVLAGAGNIPPTLAHITRIHDATDVQGPLAGILAALRARPEASWIILACDMPALDKEALDWLLAESRSGELAILPRLDEADATRVEPLFAWYSGKCLPYLEQMAASGNWRINQLRHIQGVHTPLPPPHLHFAWSNINTPEQLQGYQCCLDRGENSSARQGEEIVPSAADLSHQEKY
ncbi:MAG: molybdenum cofactor guanylyltransferase [Desulfobulbaceae bacterium]|nr:molybdenum cofactor guanylyltransferase [Desulfobulbaceae bacterium]